MRLVAIVLVAGCWTGTPQPPPVQPPPPRVDKPRPAGVATVILRSIGAGVIELEGDRATAMDDATKAMVSHCGEGNFAIVQEGEEAIGSKRAIVWRVHYQCSNPEP